MLCIAWYIFRTLSVIENSHVFRHIMTYLEPCVIPAYSEPLHIQNPGIFRTQDIFRTLSRHILAYSVGCETLGFWKTSFIQNFAIIFRTSALRNLRHIQNPVYLGTFRHIQTYSIMITLTFFLHFFHTFQRDLKRHMLFDYNDVSFNARPSLFT